MHTKHRNDTKPSIDMLRACVSYDPASGVFMWKRRPAEHFTDARAAASWNTRFADKPVRKRSRGYFVVTITVDQKEHHCRAHRVAWALMTGQWPEHEVDHRDRDRGNNRWANLREATHEQNQWNKDADSRSKTGHRGVYPAPGGGYTVQVSIHRKPRHVGSFERLDDAIAARKSAMKEVGRAQFAPEGALQ